MANDDVVDDAVVRISPDLTGFRRKLQRQLNAELAGVRGKIPLEFEHSLKEFSQAQAHVANLRIRYAKDIAKVEKSASDQYFKDLTKRFDLQRRGDAETKKSAEERARQQKKFNDQLAAGAKQLVANAKALEKTRDDALGQSLKDIGKRFDMQVAGEKATQKAVEERAAVESKAAIDRQRKDEQFLRFQQGVDNELRKMQEGRAADSLRIAHDTHDRIDAIEREGVRQRLTILGELNKVEKAALRETEKAEKASLDRRTSRVSAAQSSLSKFKPPKLIDLGGEGFKPSNLLIAGVLALTPALLAMASSAVQASTSLAALGAAGIGAGLAMTSLLVSFTPVVQAFKLAQTVDIQQSVKAQKDSVKSSKALATSAEDRAAALRDIAGAQRDLSSATRDERTAYADIHTARREAIRDLEDLRQSVIDLNNQYRSDALSVKEAQQQEANTNANFFASALERARAHQDTLDARAKLQDTALERKQKTQDLAKSLKSGIERSDPVLAAKEKARDARNRRLDARDRLANARAAQTKKAITGTIDAGAAAINSTEEQLKRLRAQMSPAQRELYDFLRSSQDLFKGFGRTMSQKTLPGFTKFIKLIALPPKGGKSTLQILSEYAGELGGKLGKSAAEFGAFTRSPLFRDDMAKIQKNNAQSLETLGKAANTFIKPVLRILAEASPLLIPLSNKLKELAERFDTFIARAEKSGALHDFFERTRVEAKKWYDIFSNVFTLLKNIFTQSVPAGGGLVDRFAKFTDKLAKWSESDQGRKEIKDFFDTIADLPFGDIGKMLLQLSTAFAAWQAVKFVTISPFFTALGILATQHPDLLARAMTDVASAVISMAEAAGKHPEAAAFLLAAGGVLKYSKGARSIAFKLLGFEAIGKFITGKIPWLEKFTKTATMNVQAGTVIVSGALGPGGAPAPGGKPGKGSKLGAGGGTIATIAALVGFEIGTDELSRLQEILRKENKEGFHSYQEALTKKPFDWDNWYKTFVDNSLVVIGPLLVDKLLGAASTKDKSAGNRENQAFTQLHANLSGDSQFTDTGERIRRGIDSVKDRQDVKDWITVRQEHVKQVVAETEKLKGNAAARQVEAAETQKSVDALAKELVAYGVGKREAYLFASQQFQLGKAMFDSTQRTQEQAAAIEKAKPKYDDLGNSMNTAAAKAHDATTKVITLGETVNGVFKEHTLGLKTEGYDVVATQLAKMWNTQKVLYNPAYSASVIKGGADTISSQTSPTGKKTDPLANVSPKIFKAAGGHIRGRGTETSDSIPAYLSNNEYVMPAKAVRYYGTDAMDAMRNRQVPRFAKGGQVMPFIVNVKGTKVPSTDELGGYGGDVPYTGKVPKGIGDVKGLTGQMMSAIVDLKAHYPQAYVSSGLRHTRVASGQKSNHWFGRAADIIPPSIAAFNYLEAKYGKIARELIYSPANNRQVWHGKPHMYSSDVRAAHFNHIHLALAKGGLVRSFDSGGTLPPGYTLAFNGTGKNETVRSSQQEKQVQQGPVRLDRRDLQLLAAAMHAGTTTVSMDGRRVAELTNKYNYLPAGV